MVVLTSLCPSSFYMVRMSYPSSRRCVANESRSEYVQSRMYCIRVARTCFLQYEFGHDKLKSLTL